MNANGYAESREKGGTFGLQPELRSPAAMPLIVR